MYIFNLMHKTKKAIVASVLLSVFILPLLIHPLHTAMHKQHSCCGNQCELEVFQSKSGGSVWVPVAETSDNCPICNFHFAVSSISSIHIIRGSKVVYNNKYVDAYSFILFIFNNIEAVSPRGPPLLS